MSSWTRPTPEQLNRAATLLVDPVRSAHFFDQLKNPEWVEPLRKEGYFSNPPEPRQEGDTLVVRPWPQSRYLLRVAAERPSDAVRAALNAAKTDNWIVRRDLLQIACAVPVADALALVPAFLEWLSRPERFQEAHDVAELCAYLAAGGEANQSLKLSRKLLRLRTTQIEGHRAEARWAYGSEAAYSWEYGHALKRCLVDVAEYLGVQGIGLARRLLDRALRIECGESEGDGEDDQSLREDYSSIWAAALDDDPPRGDPKELLTFSLHRQLRRLAELRVSEVADAFAELTKNDWLVMFRIQYSVAAQVPQLPDSLVAKLLLDERAFTTRRAWVEYAELATRKADKLPAACRATILNRILEADSESTARVPTVASLTENGPTLEAEQIERMDRWRLSRLAAFRAILSGESLAQYNRLRSLYGDPPPPEASRLTVTWHVPTSPMSVDEILSLPLDELAVVLRNWRSESQDQWRGRDGLADAVRDAAALEPTKLTSNSDSWIGVPPSFLAALFEGLRSGLRENREFDWGVVASLLNQPGARDSEELSGDFRRLELAAIHLVVEGLTRRDAGAPRLKHASAIWAVIVRCLRHEDPTRQSEAQYGPPNMDWTEVAINSVRGEAMVAVFRFMLWKTIHSRPQGAEDEAVYASTRRIAPEAWQVVDERLDASLEPSLAVRSVYGEHFQWLWVFDRQWAEHNVDRVFPPSQDNFAYWRAAWDAFVVCSTAYPYLLPILRPHYLRAVGLLAADTPSPRRSSSRSLMTHLAQFVCAGTIDADDDLLTGVAESSPVGIKAYFLSYVGRLLRTEPDRAPQSALDSLRRIWIDWTDTRPAQPELYDCFGGWFSSRAFEDDWSLDRLIKALRSGKGIEMKEEILQRLCELTPTHAGRCLVALEALAQQDQWGEVRDAHETIEILQAALENSESEPAARATLDRLIRDRAWTHLRDL